MKDFLDKYDITSNKVSANFLLLDFAKCKFKAKYFYEKLKMKGIILRSTENGYKIKNMLRLTIGSKNENLRFMKSKKVYLKNEKYVNYWLWIIRIIFSKKNFKKKIAKKIFIYEKSKSNIIKIKKLKLSGTIVKSLKDGVD